ncbi:MULTISPECIES: GNAT family N-acetyltransferase [Pseudomonas]|jgi:CelD/BcsL family acetyltransferase involved in cellulose biosynthesis|uniref:GNAT family N-acetyltransferase n=1 Tax=Pseudomonas spirodelae TaxID=3101751 RepID=A0ABU5PA97_9PSED|nr:MULTISPECIES: GNAT family N-acetyltransferase [unclassified Pseudomonas]MBU0806809.1 antimicrobial resistance protein Mig-14 [Gammaproteobacteria bacterium]MBU0884453.1 antimicrobial resistance protein Mig-14 [Gammaproteobacteria bacterium]MBU1860203.1 antimicrobial resistance protein Mig-14 [Gammaproteobacteria bacterium]MDD2160029.1 GNAT family N-acetyltransferase [Pseudomonas sp. MIL19]MEA1606597.1 GNAT family N-acetyltransferase [Pseudomonas sp. T5W1]
MLSHLRAWRERGWTPIDAVTYAEAWQRFGGSVATHPQVIERLAGLAGLPVSYLGWFEQGEIRAALPVWGRHLALSKDVLKQHGKRGLFDLGNAEIILPLASDVRVPLRHKVRYLSPLNAEQALGIREQPEGLALAREPEEYSKKFRYNQRREQRLLEEAGGFVRPMLELSAVEQALVYADLFQRRWGFEATGMAHLAEVFGLMREFMTGSLIYLNDQPVAIQILYRVEAPQWVSLEYINGGVDPQNREFSPGSVLSFINTQTAWAEARALGKPLRYSFGRADREYKDRWCNRVPVYQV